MKKKSKSRGDYVRDLDAIFSIYIRLLDADKDGYVTCPLCGSRMHRKKAQNMHFIGRSNYNYRWSVDNCHAGCMRCNVILNGNYIIYTRWMQQKYGIKFVDRMINNKQVANIRTPQIIDMIEEYVAKSRDVAQKKGIAIDF